MALELYDTLTSQRQPFQTSEPNHARIYVCGPTVYDFTHIGHARCYAIYDVLVRHLRKSGLRVTYVRGVTDVDDKILNRAKERGEDPSALSEHFFQAFLADLDRLGNIRPDVQPKVTEHFAEIHELITRLIQNGHAYESEGDVYFNVSSFAEYGKLSHRKLADLEAGACERLDENEARRKRNPYDFALWKSAAGDGKTWDSPWGKGRPGWHIECSAMSMKHLGESFDLHGGGLDLVFPHHENEIAQSECATHKPFARIWMHNGFVQVNKEKMGKSLGNFFLVREAFGHAEAEAVRYALLTVQYRSPLNLEWLLDEAGKLLGFPQFAEAEARLEYLYTTKERLAQIPEKRLTDKRDVAPLELSEFQKRVVEALDDDLNTPVALAHLSGFLKAVNELCDRLQVKSSQAPKNWVAIAESGFEYLAAVLGLGGQDSAIFLTRIRDRQAQALGISGVDVEKKIRARGQARNEKNFEAADAIRNELLAQSIELFDSPQGTNWRFVRAKTS